MAMTLQIPRKKIWLNLDVKVLKSLTAWCKIKGFNRNKVIERTMREFVEAHKNDF